VHQFPPSPLYLERGSNSLAKQRPPPAGSAEGPSQGREVCLLTCMPLCLRLGREAVHPPPSSAELGNSLSNIFTPIPPNCSVLDPSKSSGHNIYRLLQHTTSLQRNHRMGLCVPHGSRSKQRLPPRCNRSNFFKIKFNKSRIQASPLPEGLVGTAWEPSTPQILFRLPLPPQHCSVSHYPPPTLSLSLSLALYSAPTTVCPNSINWLGPVAGK
jgi:hypothetical protein